MVSEHFWELVRRHARVADAQLFLEVSAAGKEVADAVGCVGELVRKLSDGFEDYLTLPHNAYAAMVPFLAVSERLTIPAVEQARHRKGHRHYRGHKNCWWGDRWFCRWMW